MQRAEDPAPAGTSANGSGASEFEELRRLLIGRDLDQLAALQHRLDDPSLRASDTAKVLPEAIKTAPGKSLRDAMEPLFERLFRSSVARHPREISDAISPVMGPAIRSYVAAAIREFAESLNQIVEKSASWRAIRWRMEARVTGRPFTEILLARSLLYSVDQVFLIHRRSGLLLAYAAADTAVVKDADMVSGMFTAIQDFVSDSFTEAGQELETIDVGRHKLWIQYGPKAMLVGAVSGTAPVELRAVFRSALDGIHEKLYSALDSFRQGDIAVFEPAQPYLQSCLLGRRAPAQRNHVLLGLLLAAVVALIVGLVFWQSRMQRRWDGFVDAVRREPGVVVLRAEKSGSGGLIEGLKDPKAPDPVRLLADFKLDPSRVKSSWQPYLSLNTPFAAQRDLEADVSFIQAQIIRFEIAKATLPVAEEGQIDPLAAAIQRIHQARPEARIEITGHTDELGTPDDNAKLSLDRAVSIRQAFASQGVSPDVFTVIGAGNRQPLRKGGTEWDQAANRSVSFRVNGVAAP